MLLKKWGCWVSNRSRWLLELLTELKMVLEPQLLSHRGQIILELKSSEAVSEDDPSNLDYRWRSKKVEEIRIFF